MIWLKFLIGACVIIAAGIRLTKYADILSERLNLGKLWIGTILLGLITSLPEAITSFIAIVSLHAPDLAVGNLLGSNNFNPMLLVVMDVIYRQGSITDVIKASRSHKISSAFAVLLTLMVIIEMALGMKAGIIRLVGLTPATFMIILFYIAGMRLIAVNSPGLGAGIVPQTGPLPSLLKIWGNIIVSTVLVTAGAMLLTNAADTIADQTGLGRTFVGTILLAIVTSLPELVVSLSALKLGAYDLAIGNIFGSNMANMFILAICGLFSDGPLLGMVSGTHILTAVLSIWLTVIAILGIQSEHKKTYLMLGVDSILMAASFIAGTWALYILK